MKRLKKKNLSLSIIFASSEDYSVFILKLEIILFELSKNIFSQRKAVCWILLN